MPISDFHRRKLIFVTGKGGVGKTVVSQAIALAFSDEGRRTLWVTFEDPTRPLGEVRKISPTLFHLNCDATKAFEEYAGLKIGVSALARIFVQNKLMKYLAQAAPGIHELVLLGKIWYERLHYEHLVIDMPSTGYGLAMFQSTQNFARLFGGGPIHRDAEAMLQTFRDPVETGYLIVALPEETPLRESIELRDFLGELFPKNPPAMLVNRLFPRNDTPPSKKTDPDPGKWPVPFAISMQDYAEKRTTLEKFNLRLWNDEKIRYAELDYIPPPADSSIDPIVEGLSAQLRKKEYL